MLTTLDSRVIKGKAFDFEQSHCSVYECMKDDNTNLLKEGDYGVMVVVEAKMDSKNNKPSKYMIVARFIAFGGNKASIQQAESWWWAEYDWHLHIAVVLVTAAKKSNGNAIGIRGLEELGEPIRNVQRSTVIPITPSTQLYRPSSQLSS